MRQLVKYCTVPIKNGQGTFSLKIEHFTFIAVYIELLCSFTYLCILASDTRGSEGSACLSELETDVALVEAGCGGEALVVVTAGVEELGTFISDTSTIDSCPLSSCTSCDDGISPP